MDRNDISVGGVYWLASGGKVTRRLVKVTKKNSVNLKCIDESGTSWNVHPSFLSEPSVTEILDFKVLDVNERITLGTVVKYTGATTRYHAGLYVIISIDARKGTFNIAPLGGNDGHYLTNVRKEFVDKVEFDLAGV